MIEMENNGTAATESSVFGEKYKKKGGILRLDIKKTNRSSPGGSSVEFRNSPDVVR